MTNKVKVWDGFIRGYHWLLVAAFAALWYTGGELAWIDKHEQLGIFLLSMLLTRFIWGFIGSESARFRYFLICPIQLIRQLFNKKTQKSLHLTHNPWGGWSVVLLLVLLCIQAVTGLFTDDAIFYQGPLTRLKIVSPQTITFLTSWHHFNFVLLQVFVGLHIFAILIYKILGEPLIYAMIQGNKKIENTQSSPQIFAPKMVHGAWGYVILAIIYAVLTFALK